MSVYAEAAQPIAMDLYALLRELDPGRWTQDMSAASAAHLERLKAALDELLDTMEQRAKSTSDDELKAVKARLAELQETLSAQVTASAAASREQWMTLRAALLPRYEALRGALDTEAVHLPALRPTNYRRSIMHATSGFVAFTIITLLPTTGWLVGIAGTAFLYAWSMEFFRRRSPAFNERIMAFYGPVAHPHEWHRINSATWYCTALLILALTGSPLVCSIAVLVLGVADPVAALVGRRFGRTKLVNGRSLEGSLAFVAAGTAVATPLCAWTHPEVGFGTVLILTAVGAVAGSLAELFSRRVDDNLTIPVATGAAAFLLAQFLL